MLAKRMIYVAKAAFGGIKKEREREKKAERRREREVVRDVCALKLVISCDKC